VATNGVDLHVVEAGGGPPVILAHGFPELAHSWRHQIGPLAAAGYHVLAPDMRGYGRSSAPADVDAYALDVVVGDLIALLDVAGAERGVFVGHDFGAMAVWHLARTHPERVAGVVGMSLPFMPVIPTVAMMREVYGPDFYIVAFQEPGRMDRLMADDPRRTLVHIWRAIEDLLQAPAALANATDEASPPDWMSDADAEVYVDAFARTGFTAPLNYYRNLDRTAALTAALDDPKVTAPALYIAGADDPVLQWMPTEGMDTWVTDLRDTILFEGAGHWIQQERPAGVTDALLAFLAEIHPGNGATRPALERTAQVS
jgi:pimeloyl-ACP methyl ester carboxylesterase